MALMILRTFEKESLSVAKETLEGVLNISAPFGDWNRFELDRSCLEVQNAIAQFPAAFKGRNPIDDFVIKSLEKGLFQNVSLFIHNDRSADKWVHPKTGQSLAQCLIEANMPGSFMLLVRNGASLDYRDPHGNTIEETILSKVNQFDPITLRVCILNPLLKYGHKEMADRILEKLQDNS